ITEIYGTPVEEFLRKGDTLYGMLAALAEAGITEVNGVPVSEFVVRAETVDDFIDLTHGRPMRSSQATTPTPASDKPLDF
ncbi:hypothetical protein KC973_04090, partial [Candidatus Saccharibacteria bacterium]|nr:hypothetical protein [Candidatus Saccharibacteria bacterium]